MHHDQLVSVVIPTRNRPDLVQRAVRSALSQTYTALEVVVVVDGPDPLTVGILESVADTRLRVLALEEPVGGNEARNTGIRNSCGTWVGLLDDDDEWLAERVERQMLACQHEKRDILFAACRYFSEGNRRTSLQPKHFPSTSNHISEYLFCELSALGRRQTFLQTSTWFVRRDFLVAHPFTPGLKKNQDTDWLLRSFSDLAGATCFLPEPLVIFHSAPGISRISTTCDWEYGYKWAKANSHLFTDKALAYFTLTQCARHAVRQGYGLDTLVALWLECKTAVRFRPQVLYLILALIVTSILHLKKIPEDAASNQFVPKSSP